MRGLVIFIFICISALTSGAQEIPPQDRIEIAGGAILTGKIEQASDSTILLVTDYAGTLKVDMAKVQKVTLHPSREIGLPVALLQTPSVAEKDKAVAKAETKAKPVESAKTAAKPAPEEEAGGWKVEARWGLDGRGGNTRRFLSTIQIKAELERPFDRFNLNTRYTYLNDPTEATNEWQPKTKNEIILGGRYTNFFYKKLGIFVREELELDRFEGLDFRSTTASGLSYQFVRSKELRLEASSGFSYRYESYVEGFDEEFPGMDFGFDVFWKFADWGSFTGTYSYVPSVKRLDSFIFQQDSFVDLPLKASDRWKLRFGINSQYNSNPTSGRENLDFKYYASLIATWQHRD